MASVENETMPLTNDNSGVAAAPRELTENISSSPRAQPAPEQMNMSAEILNPADDEYWNDEDEDDCLLYCFTVSTGACASAYRRCRQRWLQCGEYLRERRFWLCKIIIVFMDVAILRGAMGMGAEYCSQEQEVSEFGWVLWSSFLVFCKFVYLRPVFHLHQECILHSKGLCIFLIPISQIGVFHRTASDGFKSFLLETACALCHIGLFVYFIYRSLFPGFIMFSTGSCLAQSKDLVTDHESCLHAGEWFGFDSAWVLPGSNLSTPLARQPPACFLYKGQLFYNDLRCRPGEDSACTEWLARTYGACSKESPCLCGCTFISTALLVSVVVFLLPIPIQWRMMASSLLRAALGLPPGLRSWIIRPARGGVVEDLEAPPSSESPSPSAGALSAGSGLGAPAAATMPLFDSLPEPALPPVLQVGDRSFGAAAPLASEAPGGPATAAATAAAAVRASPHAERERREREAAAGAAEADAYARAMAEFRCRPLDGLAASSVFREAELQGAGEGGALGCRVRMQRLHRELRVLPGQLLQHPNSSVWVVYDPECPQFLRAAITGPTTTPYEGGVFVFDMWCPPTYPHAPPRVSFLTTAGGSVRFSPNLYADGKARTGALRLRSRASAGRLEETTLSGNYHPRGRNYPRSRASTAAESRTVCTSPSCSPFCRFQMPSPLDFSSIRSRFFNWRSGDVWRRSVGKARFLCRGPFSAVGLVWACLGARTACGAALTFV